MSPAAQIIEVAGRLCGNCNRIHGGRPDLSPDKVILGFSIIAMIVTCICGAINYNENLPNSDKYDSKGREKNRNIWHSLRYVYNHRKESGHGILDGAWYAYTMFNFTVLCFLAVMFPLTIILPLVVGTTKVVLTYIVWYFGASIWAMVALTALVWYLQLVGCTFVMFKPIPKEKKDE